MSIFLKKRSKCLVPKTNVLSQGILMWNIKALALTVQKLLGKVKVSERRIEWQNDQMTEWQSGLK